MIGAIAPPIKKPIVNPTPWHPPNLDTYLERSSVVVAVVVVVGGSGGGGGGGGGDLDEKRVREKWCVVWVCKCVSVFIYIFK